MKRKNYEEERVIQVQQSHFSSSQKHGHHNKFGNLQNFPPFRAASLMTNSLEDAMLGQKTANPTFPWRHSLHHHIDIYDIIWFYFSAELFMAKDFLVRLAGVSSV
jgi:hypothetical protein